jgi:hypothetical protein
MERKDLNPDLTESGRSSAQGVRDDMDKAKAKASETFEEARRQGKSRVSTEKNRAAEQAGKLSDALGEASARLRDEGEPSLARYTDQLASSISGLAEKFRERSVDDLLRDTRDLARREPALFLAGSVALGFAISRFFKASTQPDHHANEEWNYNAPARSEEMPGDPDFGAAQEPTYGGAPVTPAGRLPQQDHSFSGSVQTDIEKKGA